MRCLLLAKHHLMNIFTMDKRLILENPHGYTIEVGIPSYASLDERIQAAKMASSRAQEKQRLNNIGKISLINNRVDPYSQNITVKKSIHSANDFSRKIRHLQSVSNTPITEPMYNIVSVNRTTDKNTNLHDLGNSSSLKPYSKGLMQQRLEAIKNKKKSSAILHVSDSNTKCSNISSTNISHKDAHSKNLLSTNISLKDAHSKNLLSKNSCQSNSSFSQRHEYNTRSSIQKPLKPNPYFEHCDRTRDIVITSKSSTSSVQNRLIKAKEEIKNKSKSLNQNDVTKTETFPKPHGLSSADKESNIIQKQKNKSKRLGSSIKKCKPMIKSFVSNNLNIKNIKEQPNIIVQQKPTLLNSNVPINSSAISTNLSCRNILKKSHQSELDSFSFVISSESSVQEQLNISEKEQCNDDSMEWEDVEPENIVNKVNDFRKSNVELEPMEWTPDSTMDSYQTNLCLVVDTNILLSNLKPISMVIDKIVPDYGYPTIALPWQVIQELDCIKKSENALGYRAREAARWLLDVLSKSHPRVKGQPMTKCTANPDDAILQCALNVKERVNVVYLITDDKLLQIKAEVNGLPAKNSLWIHDLVVLQKKLVYDTFKDVIAMYPIIDNRLILKCIPRLEHIVSRILRFAVKRNQEFPSYSKKTWWKIYSLRPPLNLTKCLLKLKEHWHIIAPRKMIKPPQKQVEWLVYFLKELQETPCESSFSWHEVYLFLKCCSELVCYLPFEYHDITDFFLNDLMTARRLLRAKTGRFNNSTLDDASLSTNLSNKLTVSNYNNIENIMQNILKKVETFCSNVYAASGIEPKLSKDALNCMHSRNMYSLYNVDDYCHALSNLTKNMLKIKKMSAEQILKSRIIVDEFSKSIVALESNCTELNREKLIDFCLMKDKSLFLRTLLSLQNKLSAMKNLITTINS